MYATFPNFPPMREIFPDSRTKVQSPQTKSQSPPQWIHRLSSEDSTDATSVCLHRPRSVIKCAHTAAPKQIQQQIVSINPIHLSQSVSRHQHRRHTTTSSATDPPEPRRWTTVARRTPQGSRTRGTTSGKPGIPAEERDP